MNDNSLIPRRRIYLSIVLAAITEALWITVQFLHRPADPMLFILTLGWPVYYACCLGIGLGMAWVVKTGGFGDINPFWNLTQRLFPRLPVTRGRNAWLRTGVGFALFGFPLFVGAVAAVVCYSEIMHTTR